MWDQLEDLDFADNFALLAHTQQEMQKENNIVAATSARMGINIHKGKSKVLKVNATIISPIMLEGEAVEEFESFVYLDSVVDKQGGTDADVKIRIGKAREAFQQIKNVWNSDNLSSKLKVRIFNIM